MESEALTSIDTAMSRIVEKLDTLATEHGQAAADAVLLAYQIDAISALLVRYLAALLLIGFGLWCWRSARKGGIDVFDGKDRPPIEMVYTAATMMVIIGSVIVISSLHLARWYAAFGHPELLIATKALKAAGLL